jgi:hypothetical protein
MTRERITYFDSTKFTGRIRQKNEEWTNFGVRIVTKKNSQKVEKKIIKKFVI